MIGLFLGDGDFSEIVLNKVKRLEGRRDNFRDNNAASKAEIS